MGSCSPPPHTPEGGRTKTSQGLQAGGFRAGMETSAKLRLGGVQGEKGHRLRRKVLQEGQSSESPRESK